MRMLVAIGGAAIDELLAHVAARVGNVEEWIVLHVTDARPLDEVAGLGRGLLGRGRRADDLVARMRALAAESAGQELSRAGAWLAARGLPHRLVSRIGRPEREIIGVAAAERVELIALGAGLGVDPGPGVHPLSPIACFVVDHALCDVLLLRPPGTEERDWLPPPPPRGGPPPRRPG